MQDVFITKIHIDKVRHLHNIDIELSDTERRHLILTGKNGSGKTSLLEALRDSILSGQQGVLLQEFSDMNPDEFRKMSDLFFPIVNAPDKIGIVVSYSCVPDFFDTVFAFIPAERSAFDLPKSIEPLNTLGKTVVTRNASKDFLKYILSLDYQLYGAKNDHNTALENALTTWFDNFQMALRTIYDCPDLRLQRDTKNLAFKIEMPDREPFALHEMSDGYAAVLDIYMELLMRFEDEGAQVNYDCPAIVMIDEIETHLHVELQKRVLPFLTQMFPNVQFIVSTHSPFVISSLRDAAVYDLETREQLENPGMYSYEAIVEGYLDVGQYSEEMKKTFKRYRELCGQDRSEAEEAELLGLVSVLEMVPPASKELYLAFRRMEDERKR